MFQQPADANAQASAQNTQARGKRGKSVFIQPKSKEGNKHCKPINIVLNCKFERGEYNKTGHEKPIQVYYKDVIPNKDMQRENETQSATLNRIDIDENRHYTQENVRDISKQDGLIYYYQKNNGQEEMTNLDMSRYQTELAAVPAQQHQQLEHFQKTTMLVCITMYAEPRKFLEGTLLGVQRNLRHFDKYNVGPKQIVCVVLQDGIMKMKDELVEFFSEIDDHFGFTEEKNNTVKSRRKLIKEENELYKSKGAGIRVSLNNDLPPSLPKKIALLYQVFQSIKPAKPEERDIGLPNLTVLYLNKHLNAKKLSSHMWFFEGFCRLLRPKYCAFIDVGTVPDEWGLVKYYLSLESDPNIGGVSGFLGLYFDTEDDGDKDKKPEPSWWDNFKKKLCPKRARQKSGSSRGSSAKKKQKQQQQNGDPATGELIEEGRVPSAIQEVDEELEDSRSGSMVMEDQLLQPKEITVTMDVAAAPAIVNGQPMQSQPQVHRTSSLIGQDIVRRKMTHDEMTRELELFDRQEHNEKVNTHMNQFLIFGVVSVAITGVINLLSAILYVIFKILYLLYTGAVNFFDWLNGKIDLKKAQLFEYTLAHMLDKNFESQLDFLHVLPGAWSAYRYEALSKGSTFKENLLQKKYLKQILNPNLGEGDYREANMYLAEDRILCLGIFCQADSRYVMNYIPDAIARTDAVDDIIEFINQRRRWINSSWFALEYVLRNYSYHVEDSAHSKCMKYFLLPFNMFMARLGKYNMYVIMAMFLFVVATISYQFIPSWFKQQNGFLYSLPWLFPMSYVLIVLTMVFASLTFKVKNPPKDPQGKINPKDIQSKINRVFSVLSGLLASYTFISFFLLTTVAIKSYYFNTYEIFTGSSPQSTQECSPDNVMACVMKYFLVAVISMTFGIMVVLAFFHLFGCPDRVWDIVRSTLSYLYYQSIYMHTLVIYAFCNIDDVTWGTKGLASGGGNANPYLEDKINFVGTWLMFNSIMCYIMLSVDGYFGNKGYIMIIVGAYTGLNMFTKAILAIIHHLKYYCYRRVYNTVVQSRKQQLTKLQKQIIESSFLSSFEEEDGVSPQIQQQSQGTRYVGAAQSTQQYNYSPFNSSLPPKSQNPNVYSSTQNNSITSPQQQSQNYNTGMTQPLLPNEIENAFGDDNSSTSGMLQTGRFGNAESNSQYNYQQPQQPYQNGSYAQQNQAYNGYQYQPFNGQPQIGSQRFN